MSDKFDKMKQATRAIHVGSEPEPGTGAVTTPIFQTSTYAQSAPGECQGYEYSRTNNPTRNAYERALAGIEGARFGLGFASGMAAIDAIMKTMRPGDHVLAGDDMYGGTYRLFTTLFQPLGIDFDFLDFSGDFDLTPHIRENTKMVWLESPTNPLLKVCDIGRISKAAHEKNITVVTDNTFMSPILQRPLELGADVTVYSTTKYIGGHADTVGGAIVTSDEKLHEAYKTIQNSAGAIPGPFDCFLMHRGLKTLSLRMERHSDNALEMARFLEGHPEVEQVIYPFLESHPQYGLAKRQQSNGGGMISFKIKGDGEKAAKMVSRTQVFALAESLGGVESLIEHPGIMTHASIPADIRAEMGLSDSLIRLSVGLEDIDDLKEDINQALK